MIFIFLQTSIIFFILNPLNARYFSKKRLYCRLLFKTCKFCLFFMDDDRLSGKQVGSQASRRVTRRLAWIQPVCISINAVPALKGLNTSKPRQSCNLCRCNLIFIMHLRIQIVSLNITVWCTELWSLRMHNQVFKLTVIDNGRLKREWHLQIVRTIPNHKDSPHDRTESH